MDGSTDVIPQFQEHVQQLNFELEQVVASYKESLASMQAAVNELNDALFPAIQHHIDKVEHVVIKSQLKDSSSKIRSLGVLQENIRAMEGAFVDLKCRYSSVISNHAYPEHDDGGMDDGRALNFDMMDQK